MIAVENVDEYSREMCRTHRIKRRGMDEEVPKLPVPHMHECVLRRAELSREKEVVR